MVLSTVNDLLMLRPRSSGWQSPDSGLPVLALQGLYDERMDASEAVRYISQAGERGTDCEFDGDHLLLAKRAVEVQAELKKWLELQGERSR